MKSAQQKYATSPKGKATKKAWRKGNRDKVRKWKRQWASSGNGKECRRKWWRKTPESMYSNYKRSAARRGLKFDIPQDLFVSLILKPCTYCGSPPSEQVRRNGLDRIDNMKGYVIKNVVPCCSSCNQMKGMRTVSEFLSHVEKIAQYQKGKEIHGKTK